ncbi:hypothetical protein HPB47_007486, partial [Ixodes persulcatus]
AVVMTTLTSQANQVHVTTQPELSASLPTFNGGGTSTFKLKSSNALTDWHATTGRQLTTWTIWKAGLKEQFGEQLSLIQWQQKVTALTQKPGDSLQQYAFAKLKIMSRCTVAITDEGRIEYIVQGIRDGRIATTIAVHQPRTVDDFLNIVSEVDVDRTIDHSRLARTPTFPKPSRDGRLSVSGSTTDFNCTPGTSQTVRMRIADMPPEEQEARAQVPSRSSSHNWSWHSQRLSRQWFQHNNHQCEPCQPTRPTVMNETTLARRWRRFRHSKRCGPTPDCNGTNVSQVEAAVLERNALPLILGEDWFRIAQAELHIRPPELPIICQLDRTIVLQCTELLPRMSNAVILTRSAISQFDPPHSTAEPLQTKHEPDEVALLWSAVAKRLLFNAKTNSVTHSFFGDPSSRSDEKEVKKAVLLLKGRNGRYDARNSAGSSLYSWCRGRTSREFEEDDELNGRLLENSLILHGDPSARPYRIDDFGPALKKIINPNELASLGAYQYNHVWLLTVRSAKEKERLLQLREIQVKNKTCLIIDGSKTALSMKVHWVPTSVPDANVASAFSTFGKIKSIVRASGTTPASN